MRSQPFQRDSTKRCERGGGELVHPGIVQRQATHRPRAQAQHAIPAPGSRIEAVRTQEIGVPGLLFRTRRARATSIGRGRQSIEQLNGFQLEDLPDQRGNLIPRLAGAVQQQDPSRRFVEPLHVAPPGNGFRRSASGRAATIG